MTSEFDLIRQHFSRPAPSAILGVGDDAALLQPTQDHCLAVSSDTLLAGVHFFPNADPLDLGWKALAVNLSDLAAMGALPRWVTLALTLPNVDAAWLNAFATGFYDCAKRYGVDLVGGDTTRGGLSITVTVIGEVPLDTSQHPPVTQALRRDGARLGDMVWVSGELGAAALALADLQACIALDKSSKNLFTQRLHRPTPRVELGLALRGIAHSAIDISDGLLADLGHILVASGVGAVLNYAQLPIHSEVRNIANLNLVQRCVLAGGDDYELCFTAPLAAQQVLEKLAQDLDLKLTAIGYIEAGKGVRVLDGEGNTMLVSQHGYDHFEKQ